MHRDEESKMTIARELSCILTCYTLKPCLHCAKAKARQKTTCKVSSALHAVGSVGRIYLDLPNVTASKMDGSEFELMNKWWKTLDNEATGKK